MTTTVLVVGAGFSGAVVSRQLADAGLRVDVIDSRPQVAGNCHTERCAQTGVLIHVYGPHIFHTDDAEVWQYVNRFSRFLPYRHQVKTTVRGKVYTLPINLHTINQLFGRAMRPAEARDFLDEIRDKSIGMPLTFEEQALHLVGRELYETFLRGYTEKQWGCSPTELPASILRRLPLRFNYDDNYFFHRYQGMPELGYTHLVERLLDHTLIDLHLGRAFDDSMPTRYDHIFWSGPLDGYFGFQLGRLGYRTLDFEPFAEAGDYQGCAVMNYGDHEVPFTRITEHKYFTPWEQHDQTLCFREFSRAASPEDVLYYPIRLVQEKALLAEYVDLASRGDGVTFIGRLGTYRYLDMDVTIREALIAAAVFLQCRSDRQPMRAFVQTPL